MSLSSSGSAPSRQHKPGAEAASNNGPKTSDVSFVTLQSGITNDQERHASPKAEPIAAISQKDSKHPHGLKLATVVVALCLATFLAALDQTIMATAAPKITDHFNSIDDLGW